MATIKGQNFINKYSGKGVNLEIWLMMYNKHHIEMEDLEKEFDTEEETILTDEKKAEIVANRPAEYLSNEEKIEQLQTENANLTSTIDSILTDIIPSMLG